MNGSIEIVSHDIVSESLYRTTGVVPAAVIMEDISPEREVNWDRCRSEDEQALRHIFSHYTTPLFDGIPYCSERPEPRIPWLYYANCSGGRVVFDGLAAIAREYNDH